MTPAAADRFESAISSDVRAEVTHPDRPLTAAERAHLGIPDEETS